ncbi:MAG: hypothetical protein LC734_09385, partial [Acidobacteria bacterium]|nr:hypothetical protein [Acidobacteriota bacterium]
MRTRANAINRRSILGMFLTATVCLLLCGADVSAQRVEIDGTSATSSNLKLVWNANEPERIDGVYWNPNGLTGAEPNLTNSHATLSPCSDGLLQYFGNSWAPPDPQFGGKVLVGAGTTGTRALGPDSKVF